VFVWHPHASHVHRPLPPEEEEARCASGGLSSLLSSSSSLLLSAPALPLLLGKRGGGGDPSPAPSPLPLLRPSIARYHHHEARFSKIRIDGRSQGNEVAKETKKRKVTDRRIASKERSTAEMTIRPEEECRFQRGSPSCYGGR
jgi:hypothetical protein